MSQSSSFTLARTLGVSAATVCLALAVPTTAGAKDQGCVVDEASGLPIPQTVPGICVQRSDTRTFLFQNFEEGMLVVATENDTDDIGRSNQDGAVSLQLHDRDAALVFCPATTLDGRTGAPTTDCLWDLESMSAGRAALTGTGRIFASTNLDESGTAGCPTSVTILASAMSPGGDTFGLTSSMVLSPTGPNFDTGPTGPSPCVASAHDLRLSYRYGAFSPENALSRTGGAETGLAGADTVELRWLSQLSDDELELVTELVRLDEADWGLLQRLLSLDGDQLQILEEELAAAEAALITDDGRILPAEEFGPTTPGTVVTKAEVEAIWDDILSRVNSIYSIVGTINSRVASMQANVNSMVPTLNGIANSIPDRGDVLALVGNASDIAQLSVVIQRVRDVIGGVIAIAEALREGFDVWYGSSCDPSSQCAQFKSDLAAFFADIREGVEFVQAIACLDNPGLAIRPLDTSFVEDLVIDRSPPVVLYGLYKVLERIAPAGQDEGWPTLVSSVLDTIPGDFRTNLSGLCATKSKSSPMGSGGPVCLLLYPEEVGLFLKGAKAAANRKETTAKVIDSFLKDDVVAQGGAVAAAGGSAGTNAKNPTKVVSQQAKDLADDLPDKIADIIEKRDQCLEAEQEIEADLRECQPPVSVFLRLTPDALPPHPTFFDVRSVVSRRLEQVRDCQLWGGCRELNVSKASVYLDAARDHRGTVRGYHDLCCAYQALNGGTDYNCPPN